MSVLECLLGAAGKSSGGRRCLVIAEVAQNHEGSLGTAHAFVDAVTRTGADGIKFQTHIAAAESTPDEPWRVPFSRQDSSRRDYWRRMEFTRDGWDGLHRHARERGLIFLSSPFSIEAVDLLDDLGMAAWKIASGEVSNRPMLERIAATGKPLIASTGMSSVGEVDDLAEWAQTAGLDLALLQSTSMYPCPPERVGLNLIPFFRERYGLEVGLSDHSGSIYPGLAAATEGAALIEVHVTLSREMFGPDVCASLDTVDLARLVEGVRVIERMACSPVDKDAQARELSPLREVFGRSIVLQEALHAGTLVRREHLACKKPGGGLAPVLLERVVGCVLRRDLAADVPLAAEDLEGFDGLP